MIVSASSSPDTEPLPSPCSPPLLPSPPALPVVSSPVAPLEGSAPELSLAVESRLSPPAAPSELPSAPVSVGVAAS